MSPVRLSPQIRVELHSPNSHEEVRYNGSGDQCDMFNLPPCTRNLVIILFLSTTPVHLVSTNSSWILRFYLRIEFRNGPVIMCAIMQGCAINHLLTVNNCHLPPPSNISPSLTRSPDVCVEWVI